MGEGTCPKCGGQGFYMITEDMEDEWCDPDDPYGDPCDVTCECPAGETFRRRRELGTFGGPRYTFGYAERDADDVLVPWSVEHGYDHAEEPQGNEHARQDEEGEFQAEPKRAAPGRAVTPAHANAQDGAQDQDTEQEHDQPSQRADAGRITHAHAGSSQADHTYT